MSAPTTLPDPALDEVAWDLDPLVDGQGEAGVERLLDEAETRARAFAGALRGAGRRARRPRSSRARCASLAELQELAGRAGNYAALRFSTDTADPDPRGAAPAGPGARHGDRDPAPVLRARVGGGRPTSGPTRCSPTRGSTSAAHHLRIGAPLPAPPADRARGAHPHREVGHRPRGLGAAVRRADLGHPRRPDARGDGETAHRCRSRWRSPGCSRPTARCARPTAAAVTAGARARPAHPGLPLQHAAARQGRRRPAALLPALAPEPEPGQRGERRVGRGPASTPCARATTSPSAGTASRPSCSGSTGWPTTTAWPRSPPRRTPPIAWDEARDLVLDSYALVLARAGRRRPALLRRALDRRPGRGRASAAGAFCAYTVPSAHPYVLLN